MRTVHPIEAESYRRLRAAVDTSGLPPRTRDVVERIIHTTADPGWLDDLVTDEAALEAGAAALATGAPLVVDAAMVAAGVTGYSSICLVGSVAAQDGLTRSAAAMRLAAMARPARAVFSTPLETSATPIRYSDRCRTTAARPLRTRF